MYGLLSEYIFSLTCLVRRSGAPKAIAANSYELPSGFLDSNPAPIEGQPVLLSAEPFF